MANNPFVKPTISLYNANPPPDDGTTSDDNEITWTGILAKVGNPLKTFAQAVADAVETFGTKTINTSANESNAMAGSLAFTSSELTISAGSITVVRSYHTVDTESDAATDDLDTIVLTGVSDGALLILSAANTGRTVVVKHGTGNISLADGADFSLDDTDKRVLLQRAGSGVVELPRVPAAAFGAYFESSAQTITSGGTLTIAHGISEPKGFALVLKCTSTDQGYSVGQKIFVAPATGYGIESPAKGTSCAVKFDGTNVVLRFGNAGTTCFAYVHNDTGEDIALTNSKWELYVRVWA